MARGWLAVSNPGYESILSMVGRNRQSGMSMRLKKVCPQCDATLHVRKLACPCGHVFPAKAQQTKRKRPIESRQSDNVRKAAKRACETDEETRKRQTHNKERMASIRQCEKREQTTKRQAQHQQHMGSIRASETPEQALNRRYVTQPINKLAMCTCAYTVL